jgi:segregation and condensation protein B
MTDPAPELEAALRVAEALVFAHGGPVSRRALAHVLPDWTDVDALVPALVTRWADRGVQVIEVAEGLMARTAPDLAAAIRKVVQVPRRLPRAAMEALAIIAWHQPITRPAIEEMRGATLAQSTIETLLENGLITAVGRKEAPGRPTLWGTTPHFLAQFGLASLADLPRREELLAEAPVLPLEAPAETAESVPE